MLVADRHSVSPGAAHGVGHDRDIAAGKYLEVPAIEDRSDRDCRVELLGEFADESGGWVLSRLGPTARQLPFVAIVFEQDDPAVLDQYTLYRDHRRHMHQTLSSFRGAAVPRTRNP